MPREFLGPMEQIWLELLQQVAWVLSLSASVALAFCMLVYLAELAQKLRAGKAGSATDQDRSSESFVIEAEDLRYADSSVTLNEAELDAGEREVTFLPRDASRPGHRILTR
jgi:hypothetical protein